MKLWTVIVDITPENRIAKSKEFDTEAESDIHIIFVNGLGFPDAFKILTPVEHSSQWLIDPILKDITIVIPAPTVPNSIEKVQFVRALRAAGQWITVKTELPNISLALREDWELSPRVKRDEAIITTLMTNLSITGSQMDAMFISASRL